MRHTFNNLLRQAKVDRIGVESQDPCGTGQNVTREHQIGATMVGSPRPGNGTEERLPQPKLFSAIEV
jgi:hypothetical protein